MLQKLTRGRDAIQQAQVETMDDVNENSDEPKKPVLFLFSLKSANLLNQQEFKQNQTDVEIDMKLLSVEIVY